MIAPAVQLDTTRPRLRPVFRRYWTLCKVSFQERMEFRVNVLMYVAMALLPAMIAIYLWGVIYNGASDRPQFSRLVTYYLVASFVGFRIASFHWTIMNDIREGRMANYLLRPMSYPAASFCYETGGRTWSTLMTIPIYMLVAVLLGDLFQAPAEISTWLLAILAFMVAYVVNYFLSACVGLITVWQNQPEYLLALFEVGSKWLGGVYVPLALIPSPLNDWLQWLPFAYIYSLPVRIFQGLPAGQIWQGLGIQVIWLALGWLFFRQVWKRALRRYEAFEG